MRAPCVCNGEKTGHPCRHYWAVMQKFVSANADTVRDGEKQRACSLMPGWPFEFTSDEMPTKCNRYEPAPKPGLLALVARAVNLAYGYEKFLTDFEVYHPMTLAEIAQLRLDFPDPPADESMSPLSMTLADIMNGPQIGILKPGEKVPGLGLDPATDQAIDELFSDKTATPPEEPKA